MAHEAKEEKYVELQKKGVLDEVEKLFMAKETKILGGGSSKKSDKKQIISNDLRKTYHISLAKFSQLSADELVRMIIHCDKEILDSNVVMDFLQKEDLCTIPDSTSKLMAAYSKDWTGPDALNTTREQDPAELTREDQIYLQTAFELHHYWKARMRALALTRSFEPEYDYISDRLKEVVNVSEAIRDSTSLMSVLALILDIGNYMNDTNKQASGFKLSSLARLGMVKDDKNETTFADLIERIVRNQYSQWEGFVEDISGVVTAQKLNVDQLRIDARKYIDNIKSVQSSLDAGNLSDPKKSHPCDARPPKFMPCARARRPRYQNPASVIPWHRSVQGWGKNAMKRSKVLKRKEIIRWPIQEEPTAPLPQNEKISVQETNQPHWLRTNPFPQRKQRSVKLDRFVRRAVQIHAWREGRIRSVLLCGTDHDGRRRRLLRRGIGPVRGRRRRDLSNNSSSITTIICTLILMLLLQLFVNRRECHGRGCRITTTTTIRALLRGPPFQPPVAPLFISTLPPPPHAETIVAVSGIAQRGITPQPLQERRSSIRHILALGDVAAGFALLGRRSAVGCTSPLLSNGLGTQEETAIGLHVILER